MKKTEKGDMTKNKITSAAKECFYRKSFNETKIIDIAEKADLKKPALLYHYKSKGEICQVIFEQFHDSCSKLIDEHVSEDQAQIERASCRERV